MTLVLPAADRDRICDLARAGLDSVAIRVPGHALSQEVIRQFAGPVVAPSANRSGRPSPTRFADAREETGVAAAVALDGGDCEVGLESTVVSLLGDRAQLLRPGFVTRAEIEAVVGPLEADGEGHRSPGRLALHYAPDAPVRMAAGAARAGRSCWDLVPGSGIRAGA